MRPLFNAAVFRASGCVFVVSGVDCDSESIVFNEGV